MTASAALLLLAAQAAGAPTGLATVQQRQWAVEHTAYATVEPMRTVTVSAEVTGTVADLGVLPGEKVHAGEVLARVTGPEQAAEIEGARGAERRARAALSLAEKKLAAAESTYPDLTTEQQVEEARAAVAEARAALAAAEAELASQQHGHRVLAPTDGAVLATLVADGDRVGAGTPLLRLQPAGDLWVRAGFYGGASADIAPGMKGVFSPAGGVQGASVQVRTVIPPLAPDGARQVGCVALGAPSLESGQAGVLRLYGPVRTWAAVPTPALVMSRGTWWVLVSEAGGPRRQEVEPGPAVGDWTLIAHGVEPGQRVVVRDAYLVFHSDFSRHYQPPD